MRYFLTVLTLFLLFNCAPQEPIVLRKLNKIEVVVGADGKMLLKADASLYNPNKMGAKLKSAFIEVYADNKKVGTLDKQYNQKIDGESDFLIPLEVDFDPGKGILGSILNIMSKKSLTVKYVGNIKIKALGIGYKIPVEYSEKIKY